MLELLDKGDDDCKYKKGLWYHGSIPHIDHLDLCGFPPLLSKLRTLLGIEYRPAFWINTFNRLKTLTIEDQELCSTPISHNHCLNLKMM